MIVVFVAVLAAALLLVLRPPGGAGGRARKAFGGRVTAQGTVRPLGSGPGSAGSGSGWGFVTKWMAGRGRRGPQHVSMTLVVQQLAALLKGGRTPARLWEELWLVYVGTAGPGVNHGTGPGGSAGGRKLSCGSLSMLAAARAAALRGSPVADAIRSAAPGAFTRQGSPEPRIWSELAACFDIAEASGCPLADVLARFAAQLEVEDDAEAARQTALAGPKATVSLLTWLPLMGLGLGVALGVDPLAVLLGTPVGMAAFAGGIVLTLAGRIWSARLVHAAAGAGAS
ncbi:type II secretion system F family protein [Pseudarthrobacter sp. N5]|uniref:type II secretion system F family protein n=1 Tax=Pseudarthrobacter sp. N5 TaxID=3418416 RepID=UPI003CEA9223